MNEVQASIDYKASYEARKEERLRKQGIIEELVSILQKNNLSVIEGIAILDRAKTVIQFSKICRD